MRDGLGLELQPSESTFWSHPFPTLAAAPTIATGAALFDAAGGAAGAPLRWPLLSQGPPNAEGRLLGGWRVDTSDVKALEKVLDFFINR